MSTCETRTEGCKYPPSEWPFAYPEISFAEWDCTLACSGFALQSFPFFGQQLYTSVVWWLLVRPLPGDQSFFPVKSILLSCFDCPLKQWRLSQLEECPYSFLLQILISGCFQILPNAGGIPSAPLFLLYSCLRSLSMLLHIPAIPHELSVLFS
mgnify:CR=1 FL=1